MIPLWATVVLAVEFVIACCAIGWGIGTVLFDRKDDK